MVWSGELPSPLFFSELRQIRQSNTLYSKKMEELRNYPGYREDYNNMNHNMKTYLLACASNDDTNQPAHPRSLIRVSAIRMIIIVASLGILNAPNEDSDQTARMRSLI